jgi:hypothetical protein
MPEQSDSREYLVLSRGQWDAAASQLEVQAAIDAFYIWYEQSVAAGLMKPGHRLAREGKVVSKRSVTDGPFAETKEVVGGYWFIVARSLEEAVALAAQNPCLAYGLTVEVRPVELARANVLVPANETPAQWGPRAASAARPRGR